MKQRLVASALVAMVAASACSAFAGPNLQYAADPTSRAWVTVSDITYGQPLAVGAIMLCVTSASTATITSVALTAGRGDVEVSAFAVRPNPFTSGKEGLGALKIGLAEYASGFVPGNRQEVTGVCPKDFNAPTNAEAARGSELGVEVRLKSGELGGANGLDLRYTIDNGSERSVILPFGIWLCAATCPPNLGDPSAPT